MTVFNVWAPLQQKMEALVDGVVQPMEQKPDGWWTVEVPDSGPGSDYLFRINGGEARPDPRSQFQPQGVHGPSHVIDHADFRWSDERFQAKPLSSALIYEMHVGTFTPRGTFEAAIDKLDHLVRLGVTHLEIMPVAEFAGRRGWGYDGVYPYAPHHVYGGPTGLKRLVDACHAAGIAVLLDVVYNHLGPSGNYLSEFAPYFTQRHKTPWGDAVNFDGPYSDEVRRYFIDNAFMWLRDYHFDGLRLDAIHAIIDTSAYPFLEQLTTEVKQLEAHLGRHLVLIAESDLNDPRVIHSRERDGLGFHAQWNDDFHHAVHTAMTCEGHGYYCDFDGIGDLARVFRQPYLFSGRYSPFRQRSHGRRVCYLEASSFIVCSQNHDQVGNRATGERLSHLVSFDQAKLAAALTILSPYIPMLFQGEEWAASSPFQYFVDFSEEPDLARAVSEGRREEFREFNWNPEDVPDPGSGETFLRSKLDWSELNGEPGREMLAWYRALVALRRQIPTLVDGRLERVRTLYDPAADWLLVERDNIVLAANLGDEPCQITPPNPAPLEVMLVSKPGVSVADGYFWLPAHAVVLTRSVDQTSRLLDEHGQSRELTGGQKG